MFAGPEAQAWLHEALTERYVDHRPIAVVEIADGWALIAARASDFWHPARRADAAQPRLRFGPWPDEMLRRLLHLHALTTPASSD